jgi:hypothetical protein
MTTSLILPVFLAFGLLAMLGLFITLKREVELRARKDRDRVEAMLARLIEAEARMPPGPVPTSELNFAVRPGLNLSKRVQVMRMLREGEDTSQIAAVLGLSRGEVQLLVSVQNLAGKSMSKTAGSE